MGWLPSIFGGEKSTDPLGQLDPKLREFLDKESPVKYSTNQTTTTPALQTPQQDPVAIADSSSRGAHVPAASLYQDGRYAHLWKNYQPLSQVEAETATDHDKLMSVLEGYKERKNAIGRAALENCAIQQEEWTNCMKNGSWEDQLQMCRHQVRRFERCYTMQSRFLRALGYGSVLGRPAVVDEDIQMHADTLFQRMLQHEAEVEQAKKDGTPIPIFEAQLPKAALKTTVTPTDEVEKRWREKLEKLPEDERAAEEAALKADLQAKADVAKNVKQIWEAKKEEREARQSGGQGTIFESLSGLFRGK